MAKGDKKTSRVNEVKSIEATINMHKRLHGVYVFLSLLLLTRSLLLLV
jgi:hypothetical protein